MTRWPCVDDGPVQYEQQMLLAHEYRNPRPPDAAEQLHQRLAKQQPTPEVISPLLGLIRLLPPSVAP